MINVINAPGPFFVLSFIPLSQSAIEKPQLAGPLHRWQGGAAGRLLFIDYFEDNS